MLSPYLAWLTQQEPDALAAGPDAACDLALGLLTNVSPTLGRAQTAALLRQVKRRVALAAATADIGGLWTLAQVTGALSDLAEGALRVAVAHLLRAAHDRGDLRLPHPSAPQRGSGFTVLAMGKLGARELNFSSDVDLILVFDSEPHAYNADALGAIFARLARDLVTLMQQRDAGGYVFRTDLRLRPDPASTPPAVSLLTALAYYEGAAHTWERAAMIKARPVAGDLALGRRFLDAIRPFVWRRHLDFAAIADIRAMKRRMDDHKGAALRPDGAPEQRLLGHDLKLGQGGIREIEFCAQMLQLVWGGRNPALRAPATLDALAALGAAGHLPLADVAALSAAYDVLRRTEHRLQMVEDRQTHSLPATPDAFAGFAAFMGDAGAHDLAARLLGNLDRVHAIFAGLLEQPGTPPDLGLAGAPMSGDALALGSFGDAPGMGSSPPTTLPSACGLSAAPGGSAPAPTPTLANAALSLSRPPHSPSQPAPPPATPAPASPGSAAHPPPWQAWLAGRPRALRTERARALLADLLPALTATVERQPDAGAVWTRLDEFIHRLPAGVQLFSMLRHNPALLDRLCVVLGAAPSLADHLAAVPAALEGLVAPQDIDATPAASLAAQLGDARAPDEALAIASRFVRGEEFRLAVAELDGRIGPDVAGAARTAVAEAAITQLLPLVLADHARRYGRLRGGSLAVVALGKAGGREMMAGSDLDLMLVYDHPPDATQSTGAVRLDPSQYFTRAAHALVAALTVPTRDGKLYDVDMRLRPSGGKGPVAVSLPAFIRYHHESAWTWERLALTRARVVAGPAGPRRRVAAAVSAALTQGDPALAIPDTLAMRRRQLADMRHPAGGDSVWDVKHRAGGLIEVEFIAQALQLRHADTPRLMSPTTRTALANLAKAGFLAESDARLLIRADAAWRTIQGLLRITLGRSIPAALPPAVAARLAGALGCEDLVREVAGLGLAVRALFVRYIGGV